MGALPLTVDQSLNRSSERTDDEFLIIGCDGMHGISLSVNKQNARGLRRHDDPEQCAESIYGLSTSRDNLTVVVV
ncbi:hypothetical protein Leryth_005585 [Lithospermum erythrorhizon]|nr:hypothetical protein Leryth_005585 [Lithospermum erythrorhizon]